VFVVNSGPTPQDKLKNQPNAPAAGGPAKTGKSKKGAATASDAGDESETAAGKGGQARPKFHADSVPVHVDFVIGTQSVLSDGELTGGQQVVVDGQEKLVDGGNVSPQASKTPVSATPGSQSAGGDTQGTSPTVPASGQRSASQSGPGSTVGTSGNASGSSSSGSTNGNIGGGTQ
jgi:hypothetical protein